MQTLLLGAIAIAAIWVYLPFLVVGATRAQVGYDVSAPRALFDQLPPYGQRATWAHQNAWEAFALFTAAALMAAVAGVDADMARIWVMAHLIARGLFPVFYILDIPLLRSLMFAIGSVATFSLMTMSVLATLQS